MGYQQIKHIHEHADWYIRDMWYHRIVNANQKAKRLGLTGRITLDGWLSIYQSFDGKCANCGSDEYISIDHVVPFSRGGENVDANLQPLCRACNLSKRNQLQVPKRWW